MQHIQKQGKKWLQHSGWNQQYQQDPGHFASKQSSDHDHQTEQSYRHHKHHETRRQNRLK